MSQSENISLCPRLSGTDVLESRRGSIIPILHGHFEFLEVPKLHRFLKVLYR